ncbi:MAG: addiction module protein [Dehalococcoidia bacterium]|nr:addiction module protein [Dehalococcoidia bacterium]|tara:strand:- start:41 stop:343 length:303 start_codon:yes stop_codon:yes gene_type:complete
MDPGTIEHEALGFPPEDQAKLAQKLLLSLDSLSEDESDQVWPVEADRRARELDRGDVQPIAAEEVRKKARNLLRLSISFTRRLKESTLKPSHTTRLNVRG